MSKPFDPELLRRARKIAEQYRIVLEPNAGLGYIGSSIELPNVFADGKTPAACVDAIREALGVAVATMLEAGQQPPSSRARRVRNIQTNIRLTADERLRLSEAAHHLGFKGLGDFMRTVALERSASL